MRTQKLTLYLALALMIQSPSFFAQEKAENPVPIQEAQQSWKLAAAKATPANMISVPKGFAVDLVRSANEGEGSWITLEFDDKNQLYVAKEDKGILRFTLDSNGYLINSKVVNDDLEQCRGLLWAHNSLYVNSNNGSPPPMKVKKNADGLFRLKDLNGDGVFESKKKLLETSQGSPGHGRNQLKLGPDGLIYFMSGYDVVLTDKVDKRSFLKNFAEDQLIPNPWDEDWFNKHAKAPGGHLIRMNADGGFFQLIAGGFRNPMDIAFNREGEIFTYDADMEWDAALAWYKPTRVIHVVSGGDYGWRRATGKWPTYYEDSLPAAVDVGLGSPTGVEFGYKSKFPGKWKEMLFTGDWTYGRILAVNLEEKGSSFSGGYETFASGRPMNVVDLTFGPDGHLYFVTGGMKTKSGIYRVRWVGEAEDQNLTTPEVTETSRESVLRNLRYQLEFFQVIKAEKGAKLALHYINHPDEFVRHAARVALENQEPQFWVDDALNSQAPAAFVALARSKGTIPNGALVERMNQIDLGRYGEPDLLSLLRAYQVEFIRNGIPKGRNKANSIASLSKVFPHRSSKVNYELAELLVVLEAPQALPQLTKLIEGAKTTEDLSQYLVYGRYLDDGWSLESKRTFLKGVQRLESFPGGKFHAKVVGFLRTEMVEKLSKSEKVALQKWIEPFQQPAPEPLPPAEFVKAWTVDDFGPYLSGPLKGRNFDSGKLAYSKANCVMCHKMGSTQPLVKMNEGPDLTNVGGRFGSRDLLVSIIHPSRAINDKYRNLAAPNISPMPPSQINVLKKDEVLDLIAYLQSGARKEDSVFDKVDPSTMPVVKVDTPDITKEKENDLMKPKDNLENAGIQIEPTLFKKMSAANLDDRERLYNDMKRILEIYPNATFELIGHADDSKYSSTNLDISKNRANFTAQNMIYRGIPKSAVTYSAVGNKEPSPKGNRRVEIKVKLGN